MMDKIKWVAALLLVASALATATVPAAEAQINIVAKTVLASNEGNTMDPALGPLLGELRSVFRYSSYRLLGQNRLSLAIKQSGTVSLPGNHTLQIIPNGISANRAEMQLSILKNGSRTFNTVVQLRNGASVTVGGPKHQGGYLLFNIFASF
jgi:hypothetical protein